jgi:molybdopterin molybdotransferase
MTDLMPVKEARKRMLSAVGNVPAISVPLESAFGRILAETVVSDVDLPYFTNSSMDGFAVIAADTVSASEWEPVNLQIVEDIPAGKTPMCKLERWQAARIMTGAPMPDGADAVIPIENTDHYQRPDENGQMDRVGVFDKVSSGDSVRSVGQDMRIGQKVLEKGKKLAAQDIGILATLGITSVPVYQLPKIALLSSGDELISPGEVILPGKIRDANTDVLLSLIQQHGGDILRLGIVPDIEEKVRHCLDHAVSKGVDMIVTSAGVSVGVYDYVRKVIEDRGELSIWRVNMRPGKPVAFGSYLGVPIIGLPGNPVSAYVGFVVFVLPVLRKLGGETRLSRNVIRVALAQDIESDGRESYLRARLSIEEGHQMATLTGHQGSGNLLSLVEADALIIIPAGVRHLPEGTEVDAWPLSC